jgi:hypothetical protein
MHSALFAQPHHTSAQPVLWQSVHASPSPGQIIVPEPVVVIWAPLDRDPVDCEPVDCDPLVDCEPVDCVPPVWALVDCIPEVVAFPDVLEEPPAPP